MQPVSELEQYLLIIFDVDGTLTTTTSGAKFRRSARDWMWLPGRLEILAALRASGVRLGYASNQGGVAFGKLRPDDMRLELARMAGEAHITYGAYCFSHPQSPFPEYQEPEMYGPYERRKPGPGMLIEIMELAQVIPAQTLFVGGREEDEQAAKNAGVAFGRAEDFFDWTD